MNTYPCPFCGSAASLDGGCPACGRAPDPEAAEVIRLGEEIVGLAAATGRAHQAYLVTAARLADAQARRNALAARVAARARTAVPAAVSRPGPAPSAAAGPAPVPVAPGVRPETSTRTVQAVLFVLGGLLLGTAAIVFTAVAWATFGVGGRAAILGTLTALALGAPVLLVRRGLTGTAETLTAVGLLLVLLDGYAAWDVNLFGVADGSASAYAGVVCAITAAVAVGHRAATGLVGPRFVALLTAQPVLPLLIAQVDPDSVGWAFVYAAVAVGNAAAAAWWSREGLARPGPGPVLRACAWALFGGALLLSGVRALAGLGQADGAERAALASVALVTPALVLVLGSVLARRALFQSLAGAVLVLAVALAASRYLLLVWPSEGLTPLALVAVGLAVAVAASGVGPVGRALPRRVRTGPWAASLAVSGFVALFVAVGTLVVAGRSVEAALPAFAADLAPTGRWDWQPAAALLLVALAIAVLLPRAARVDVGFAALVPVALAAPAAVRLPWWGPAAIAAAVAGTLAVAAVRARTPVAAALRAVAAAGVGAFAVLAALGRTGVTAAVLFAFVGVGVLVARLGVRAAESHRRVVGGLALTAGLLAWPAAIAAGLAALRVEPWWTARATVAATGLLVVALALVLRGWRPYRPYAFVAALTAAVPVPVWAVAGRQDEPSGLYAAVALLLIAAAVSVSDPAELDPAELDPAVPAPAVPAPAVSGSAVPGSASGVAASGALAAALGWAAAVLPGAWWLVASVPALDAVLFQPYGWLDEVWGGRPAGVGLSPDGEPTVAAADAVALAVVAVAAVVALASGRAVAEVVPGRGLVGRIFAGRIFVRRVAGRSLAGWIGLTGRLLAGWAAAPPLALAVPVALAAAGAPWPAVPGVTLLVGLGLLGALGLSGGPAWGTRAVPTVAVGVALVGAGLAGSLPARGVTLAALGVTLAVASAVGAAGRTRVVRVVGWLSSVSVGLLLAFASAEAAGLDRRWSAYAVLAAAALALAVSAILSAPPRPTPAGTGADLAASPGVEARALEGGAFAGAVVALLLSVGSARHAAGVCTLWGIVLGLRALWPRERAGRRRAYVAVAGAVEVFAWWLLMVAEQVAVPEAYTLPAAAVGVLIGWLALRSRPSLNSWLAYGPALAAALLPSLGSVLVGEGAPLRRLLLGVGALAVLLAGAAWRRQAPVVLGGAVAAAVALHEVVLVWDELPRWIPLAAAGLLLVGLAMTLERRRRDLTRVRDAVARMT